MIEEILSTFIIVFIILDPFMSIPLFITLTSKYSQKERSSAANQAILIAGVLAAIFLFAGTSVLDAMGITLNSFRIGGGIVLALMGLENVLGLSFINNNSKKKDGIESIAVLIATPLLTGPGMATTLILLSTQVGTTVTAIATILALAVAWIILSNAQKIAKIVGNRIILIASKIIGLMLIAFAIELIRKGLGG